MNVKNLTTGLKYSFGGLNESVSYTYKESMDNAPENANFTNGSSSSISYDSLGRKYRDYINSAAGNVLTSTYSYVDHATEANRTSGLVSKIDYNLSSLDDIEYEYDSRGNITQITSGGFTCDKYTYDSLNRLTRVDSVLYDQTCVYTYDASGNILTKTIYDCDNIDEALSEKDLVDTITYTYGAVDWKDRLTAYDGNYIDYDEIGNPLSYNGKTFTWVGRRLNTFNSGSTTTSYTYNADGIRTSKTVGSTKTEYFLNGSQILAQKTGSNVIPFYYDANGTRIAFKYDNEMYYYVYNLQGDVTHILNASGGIVDSYEYDEWGKILNIGALSEVGNANPFRYRGYYYDNESGLYYLNSRYYNAEWGRFINADSAISGVGGDIRGYNLFAYCMNNPINLTDEAGNWPKWVETTTKIVSVVAVVTAVVITVSAVSAFTAGTGSAAAVYGATIFLGAALSGINGAVANKSKGNSYFNGYVGGLISGGTQSALSRLPGGTVWGGALGTSIGTAATMGLNNRDPDSANSTASEIATEVKNSAIKATATSMLTASIGSGVGGINYKTSTLYGGVADGCCGLMPSLTLGFGEGIKAFFGAVDDALVYIWE